MSNMSTTISPVASGVGLTNVSATQIVAANPTRRGLIIHNPNTVTMWIAPLGSGNAPTAGGAGSFAIVAMADRIFLGDYRATCGWAAIMASGAGNSAVLEFIG
jgi:hypothetical protein